MKVIESDGLFLELNDEETFYTVVGCNEDAERVKIPFKFNGLPVLGIREKAFADKIKLQEVEFPSEAELFSNVNIDFEIDANSGFEIGAYAFRGCNSLKRIVIPDGVTEIGWGAFQYCASLEEAEIPDCNIDSYAFYHCERLKRINPITTISDGVFSHCKALEVFPVAEGTRTLGEDCFEHCYALTEITIPKSVKRIEPLAFRNCHGLKSVVFEEPNGWVSTNGYTMKKYPLDLSDPQANARKLASMDFDDGCDGWFRQ